MDNILVNEAYNTMAASFLDSLNETAEKKSSLKPVDILEHFVSLKSIPSYSSTKTVDYKFEVCPSESNKFLCFAILPTGSCFGSTEPCDSYESAQQSAAKVAFINAVMNEHPSRQVSESSIKEMIQSASFSFVDDPCDMRAINTFQTLLHSHLGETMLELQNSITTFQLLHWSDKIAQLKSADVSREEVLRHYSHRAVDDELTTKLARHWLDRGVDEVTREISKCAVERAEMAGKCRECRFAHEKLKVLKRALYLNQLK